MPYTFKVKTLGCPVNQYEGRALELAMKEAGFVPADDIADIYIINSCVVTQSAAAEARRLASQAKKENPRSLVVLAGCYPQVYWKEIKERLPLVDIIIGTTGRSRLPDIIARHLSENHREQEVIIVEHEPGEEFEDFPLTGNYGRTRPVLKIQEGCDESCTYCIVRKARGLPRSLAPEKVIARVKHFLDKGCREIVLAGTHLGTYGKDFPGWNLARLIKELDSLAYPFRLRLSYIEPMDISTDFLETIAWAQKICPFLYLPLQSGSDRILRRMGRRYTSADFARLVQQAKELMPGLSIWSDLIVGFPGETEEDHRQTMRLVERLALSHVHVFPYSPRPGTEAASYPDQVAPDVKKRRVRELRALDEELSLRFNRQLVGKEVQVLVEKIDENHGEGFSEHYVKVRFPVLDPELKKGFLVPVRIRSASSWGVEGYTSLEGPAGTATRKGPEAH
ncbi:tRNA (N(6)-L-threonylcarbamoyladenosine(37)-C(2))-methylthiotransferase MtaB [Desulfofundulus sp.]|uniref:tRNA (N(6)-L-threonylcarbamoyladenosine(37)-C(2))- methylthiotransferase MtaB n=1 Tax=Desulfofundulus sp. TaxID=2282750 RepID=UPI003C710785